MKTWKMSYRCGDDAAKKFVHFHESEESAQRDACFRIITIGLTEMDDSDDEHRKIARDFLLLVEQGEFALALQGYKKEIEEGGWDEDVEVEMESLLTSGDTPLLRAVSEALEAWPEEKEAEDGDTDDEA